MYIQNFARNTMMADFLSCFSKIVRACNTYLKADIFRFHYRTVLGRKKTKKRVLLPGLGTWNYKIIFSILMLERR